ncbi:hypothetical protein GE253_24975 [Niveispirillum sp. SYP-B3756]|uniref:hypothetical protein n=1 Tax=Niveispirillum sp. SYP-B3756 TaxID=2662178 RepID=UPI0012921808|nr:hypothetical protein [Niveispirillum sp. SYP-B3756]MQP68572.1 hypothetical protein [Niveispirillum sp. SYP-B3756]
MTAGLPDIALSVRQPWAWAIVAGHKDVENRSTFAVTTGATATKPIAIHAAKGMTRDEYEEAAEFMAKRGVTCPRPNELIRSAIIGTAVVTAVVARYPSPWFFGPRGLVLRDQRMVDPIPAVGQLGYFKWSPAGSIADISAWMATWPAKSVRPGSRPAPPAPADLFN